MTMLSAVRMSVSDWVLAFPDFAPIGSALEPVAGVTLTIRDHVGAKRCHLFGCFMFMGKPSVIRGKITWTNRKLPASHSAKRSRLRSRPAKSTLWRSDLMQEYEVADTAGCMNGC